MDQSSATNQMIETIDASIIDSIEEVYLSIYPTQR